MAITTKRLQFGLMDSMAVMPRKGGLYFSNNGKHYTWVPDTADLHVLREWLDREITLRTARATELVTVGATKPATPSRKARGSVVPLRSSQASQRAVMATVEAATASCSGAEARAPWDGDGDTA